MQYPLEGQHPNGVGVELEGMGLYLLRPRDAFLVVAGPVVDLLRELIPFASGPVRPPRMDTFDALDPRMEEETSAPSCLGYAVGPVVREVRHHSGAPGDHFARRRS